MKIMCNKCFAIMDMGSIDVPKPKFLGDARNSLLVYSIVTNCDCCPNESASIQVDDELAGIVSRLNMKGYKTLGCCAGHSNQDRIYILFMVKPYKIAPGFTEKDTQDGIMWEAEYKSLREKSYLLAELMNFTAELKNNDAMVNRQLEHFCDWVDKSLYRKELAASQVGKSPYIDAWAKRSSDSLDEDDLKEVSSFFR